ncbi:MAG: DbpA RNA binding domain-containing protein [Bacteroidia bacterium]
MGSKGEVVNFVRSEVDRIYLDKHHRKIELPIRELTVPPADLNELKVKPQERWVKYHFSRGKKDKIRKGDIVGFLIANAGLQADEIGTITVYDSYAIVDMPAFGYENLKAWEEFKIKGKSLRVRPYSAEEQAKRAKAVKKLLKDRRK